MIGIKQAIRAAEGGPKLAEALGVTHQAIYYWSKVGWVPLPRAMQIERLYGIHHHKLISPAVLRLLKTKGSLKALDLI